MSKNTSAEMRKMADFSSETWTKIVPKNEDGERCWLSYADKARLALTWEVGGSC